MSALRFELEGEMRIHCLEAGTQHSDVALLIGNAPPHFRWDGCYPPSVLP